jgi:hypothetical protein
LGISSRYTDPIRDANLLRTSRFIESIRCRLEARPADAESLQLQKLRRRPSFATILTAAGEHFDRDPADWSRETRSYDASRTVAAYLVRRRFGYRARAVVIALGYGSGSAVSHAIRRVENGPAELRRSVERIPEAIQ